MPKTKKVVEMIEGKVCKSSVRYETNKAGEDVTNIYVNKTFADPMPKSIKVTIESND